MCKEFKKALGENLRKIRLCKTLTQEYVALESGISRSHIAMIESGKRDVTISVLFKISRAMNISLKDFFEFDNLDKYKFDIEKLYE